MSNTYKVIHNPYTLWMCIYICPYQVTALLCHLLKGKSEHSVVGYRPILVGSHINVKHT
jgi:hypothetical protein